TDIRLGVKGIIKYNSLNTLWGNFVLMDIESYRQCLGYFTASEQVTELSNDQQNLLTLDEENLDALFGESSTIVKQTEFSTPKIETGQKPVEEVSVDVDRGSYNMVLIRTKKSVNPDKMLSKLNDELKKSNLGVRAVPWKKALGTIGSMAALVKASLFSFVMMLFVVAIIIIINTLSMAALERTSEIGMMRAVGAHKNFIITMFIGETGLLSFAFGGSGIVVGMIIIKFISLLHITSDNDIVQLLYGGTTFNPFLNASDVMLVILQLALVTLLAVIYPVKVASSITPLDAISRD
ncbi:MAG: FtsX-like permease family protein, partial [Fibrobacter sp.]|nr:FtsX-like permease family protein [Fibrobacter sp.]